VLERGVRRIDLGGKALTNHLKELVSFRCAQRPCSDSFGCECEESDEYKPIAELIDPRRARSLNA
jgi:hypothetical protein